MSNDNKKPLNQLSEAEKRRMRILLNFSGLLFLLAAGYVSTSPEAVESLLGLDKQTQTFLTIALAVAAFGDFIIARILFGKKDRA